MEFYYIPEAFNMSFNIVKSYYYHLNDSITIFCISELVKTK